MPRVVISTPAAPEYPSYSQAVKVGDTIYVAGTVGVDVATGELAGPTIREQTRQSLLNCQAILRAGGAEPRWDWADRAVFAALIRWLVWVPRLGHVMRQLIFVEDAAEPGASAMTVGRGVRRGRGRVFR